MAYKRRKKQYVRRKRYTRNYSRTRRPRYRRKRVYKRKYRSRRRLPMSKRFGHYYSKEFFRAPADNWIIVPKADSTSGVPGQKAINVAFGWSTFLLPAIENMFRNKTINYEMVKIQSYSWHFFASMPSQQYEQHQGVLELYKLYDADDKGLTSDINNLCASIDCKFQRLKYGSHYQLKLRPSWPTLVPRPTAPSAQTNVAIYPGGKMECPWWDTVDLNQKLELQNMPDSQNCWKLCFLNYGNFDVSNKSIQNSVLYIQEI